MFARYSFCVKKKLFFFELSQFFLFHKFCCWTQSCPLLRCKVIKCVIFHNTEYWTRIVFHTIWEVTNCAHRPRLFQSDFQWAQRTLTLSAVNVKTEKNSVRLCTNIFLHSEAQNIQLEEKHSSDWEAVIKNTPPDDTYINNLVLTWYYRKIELKLNINYKYPVLLSGWESSSNILQFYLRVLR